MTLSYQRLSHPKNKEILSWVINLIYDNKFQIPSKPFVIYFQVIYLHIVSSQLAISNPNAYINNNYHKHHLISGLPGESLL